MLLAITVLIAISSCGGPETLPGQEEASRVEAGSFESAPLLPTPTFIPSGVTPPSPDAGSLPAQPEPAQPDPAASRTDATAPEAIDPAPDDAAFTSPSDDVPPDFIRLAAGADLQAQIIANPAGTRFLLAPGIYQPDELQPRPGNWIVGEPGAIFDGGNSIRFAIRNKDRIADVVLQGIEVRNYVPQRSFGAIDMTTYRWRVPGDDGFDTADYGPSINWYLSDLWVHHNDGEGIVVGSGVVLENVRSTDNTWLGIGGHGDGIVIDGGVVARNSISALEEGELNWHSGGMKITVAKNVLIRNVHVTDNYGLGIWLDISVQNARIEHNLIENNAGIGIFYEISYAGDIRNNVVRNNALQDERTWFWPAGILVTSSTGVDVTGNHVSGSPVGIAVADTRIERADDWFTVPPGLRGPEPYRAAFVNIIENVVCDIDRMGVGREVGLDDREVLDTTVFSRNTYGTVTSGFTADPQRNVTIADWQSVREPSAIAAASCPPAPTEWQAPPG